MFEEPKFWVAVAFVMFLAAVWKPVSRAILSALDRRAARIQEELAEALRLKEEAASVLSVYQRNHQQAEVEVAAILEQARKEATQIADQAKAEIEVAVKKRIAMAEQKISQAEAAAIKDIRDNAVDITISAARSLIVEHLGKEVADEIIKSAMADMGRKFH